MKCKKDMVNNVNSLEELLHVSNQGNRDNFIKKIFKQNIINFDFMQSLSNSIQKISFFYTC